MVSPHYNIVVIYTGAQRLVGQDAPVAHDDASFTAETGGQEGQRLVILRDDKQIKQDFLLMCVSSGNYLSSSSPSP